MEGLLASSSSKLTAGAIDHNRRRQSKFKQGSKTKFREQPSPEPVRGVTREDLSKSI